MAVVGYLGEAPYSAGEDYPGILFTVSSEKVETLTNMVWSGSARYAVHQRHMTHAYTEFIGLEPDRITFDMVLSASLGVDPMAELIKLWDFERKGTVLQMLLGEHGYGKYRWNVVSHSAKPEVYDGEGNLYCVTVSVTLRRRRKPVLRDSFCYSARVSKFRLLTIGNRRGT